MSIRQWQKQAPWLTPSDAFDGLARLSGCGKTKPPRNPSGLVLAARQRRDHEHEGGDALGGRAGGGAHAARRLQGAPKRRERQRRDAQQHGGRRSPLPLRLHLRSRPTSAQGLGFRVLPTSTQDWALEPGVAVVIGSKP
jgi:hypothetical protein